jgi:hypothetical protein
LAFAKLAIASMVLNGCSVLVARNELNLPTCATGVKSEIGSYGRFLKKDGATEWVVFPPTRKVYPSASDRAT